MKKLALYFLSITSFLCAQEEFCNCPPPHSMGYNLPSRIEVCESWDIYTDFSFIYWIATQSNMEIGIVSDLSDPNYYLNGTLSKLNFNYAPGFQVGIGVNLDRDQWDLFLRYTWYQCRAQSSVSLNNDGDRILYPSWQLPDFFVAYFDGDENWSLNMDFLDFELAKAYAVGVDLSYRSFIGIRAALIKQDIKVNYENVSNPLFLPRNRVFVQQSSSSWGIGPRVGIETDWNIGSGFTFFGNGGVDLLFTEYTKLKTLQKAFTITEVTIPGSLISVKEKDDQHIRAHFDLGLGFGYGTYFACRKAHANLDLGYQFQVFFDQNMFRTFVDDQTLGKADSPHGNLYMHGLTATLRLDF